MGLRNWPLTHLAYRSLRKAMEMGIATWDTIYTTSGGLGIFAIYMVGEEIMRRSES